VVVRSLVGKRKLDAASTRRSLDRKLYELGERVVALVREGRMAVPNELAVLLAETRELENKLQAQQADIAALESEAA
jgi:hypothetical protein